MSSSRRRLRRARARAAVIAACSTQRASDQIAVQAVPSVRSRQRYSLTEPGEFNRRFERLSGITPEEFCATAVLSDAEFETALEVGVRNYLRARKPQSSTPLQALE